MLKIPKVEIQGGGRTPLENMQLVEDFNMSPGSSQGIVASGPKVPGATTLTQYYQGLGQGLPSLQERSPLYEQAGLGPASSYQGYGPQNDALLEFLQNR